MHPDQCTLPLHSVSFTCRMLWHVSPHRPRLSAAQESAVRNISLQHLLDRLSIPADSVRFRVVKSERSFTVLALGSVLKVYPCVLGEVPLGDKPMQVDRRTPEGVFTFWDKYPHRTWHRFVWVDHPSAESRRRFNERKWTGAIPANANIGGDRYPWCSRGYGPLDRGRQRLDLGLHRLMQRGS